MTKRDRSSSCIARTIPKRRAVLPRVHEKSRGPYIGFPPLTRSMQRRGYTTGFSLSKTRAERTGSHSLISLRCNVWRDARLSRAWHMRSRRIGFSSSASDISALMTTHAKASSSSTGRSRSAIPGPRSKNPPESVPESCLKILFAGFRCFLRFGSLYFAARTLKAISKTELSHCEASFAEAIYRWPPGLWIECPALGFRK